MAVTIAQLEYQIESNKDLVERRELALKLSENRTFRKLIIEEFCTNECAKYVQASVNPNLRAEERAHALAMAQSAGFLRQFLSVCVTMGNQAANTIAQAKEQIEELRAEGAPETTPVGEEE